MTRALIIIFDALRPEFVTLDLMPNLHAFAQAGVRCTNHHSTFPTETRVNQSAVTTGCYPHRHGIVANNFPLDGSSEVVRTGDDIAFEAMLNRMDEALFDVPTLAEILHQHGKKYASISAGTSGGGRLINLHAQKLNSTRFTLRRPEASVPAGLEDRIAQRIGPMPEYEQPAIAWNQYAADAWLDYVDPEIAPDVSLLWLCEPDESFHWHGIGSSESLDAIRGVDAAFGTILTRKAGEVANGDLQIIAMSDHGQISLDGGKLNLAAKAQAAGFETEGDTPDYVVSVHNAGGIWVRDQDPDKIMAMVDWLQVQPFVGPVFTREGIAGTLRHCDIMTDHARAPDIYLTLATLDGKNAFGIQGLSADNAPYPEGGGCHGGLSRFELHNVLALGGSAFGSAQVISSPTGNVDILPTMLHLLDVPLNHTIDGRCLTETLVNGQPRTSTIKTIGTERTRLQRSETGDTRYLDCAWIDLSQD